MLLMIYGKKQIFLGIFFSKIAWVYECTDEMVSILDKMMQNRYRNIFGYEDIHLIHIR